ncbi:hypothetical protein DFJ58DRAFT_821159 [Suillus subalutaceus]|uniref:uncharacterized protein n=1 Tax=Suillus subalutaceus TaxID=48586 RepID=UPI001B85C241|nr:uncharacterized protein DFJ58DRAFT_821159 [Suillus subalutaceus]KAG1834933.1 hypothetical protein DFJ58DRAFT_821159 [Suillus subalutaceus]
MKAIDSSDVYTVPVLSDPNTGALITDSLEIASYLEKTYPEKPIFPNNSEPLIRAFDSAYMSLILSGIKLSSRSVDVPLPWDPNCDAEWKLLEKGYNTAYEWYQKTVGKWIMGNTFSYADIVVACWLVAYKRVLKDDEWARIILADVEKEYNLA